MKKHEILSPHSRAARSEPSGFADHLAHLRFPGRVLGAPEDPPSDMLVFIASQIGVAPEVFAGYARRDETPRAHLGEIQT
jgi:TnpA family transposase